LPLTVLLSPGVLLLFFFFKKSLATDSTASVQTAAAVNLSTLVNYVILSLLGGAFGLWESPLKIKRAGFVLIRCRFAPSLNDFRLKKTQKICPLALTTPTCSVSNWQGHAHFLSQVDRG